MTDLSGKGAVITGASRGIGSATARVLAEAGAHVILAARTAHEIEDVAKDIEDKGGSAEAVTCDVTDYAAFEAAIAACETTAGQLDILVNNAGVIDPIGHLSDSDPEAWVRAAAINYKSIYYGLRLALPRMKQLGTGTIINISSGAAHGPMEGWSHYCSAKAGAHMLTRCADKECRDDGVTVMGLSPGTVATEMQELISASGMNPVSQLDWSAHVPPEWPAKAILWLCGPDGRAFAGEEVKLRDEDIRQKIGLV
jgi:NAD(P)-dependent dehydrogenase (short-subunit alcohol dehydrogenase family)